MHFTSGRSRTRTGALWVGTVLALTALSVLCFESVRAWSAVPRLRVGATTTLLAEWSALLSAAALLSRLAERRRLSLVFSACVGACALAMLFLAAPGSESPLGEPGPAGRPIFPLDFGHSRFPTGIGFLLASTLLGLASARRWRFAWVTVGIGGTTLGALGAVDVLRNAIHLPSTHGWNAFAQLPPSTALEFLLLGGGLILLSLDEERRTPAAFRRWHAGAVTLGTAIMTLGLLQGVRSFEIEDAAHMNRLVAGRVATQFQMAVDSHLRALRRQAGRWKLRAPTQEEWESDARLYVEGSALPIWLTWADRNGRVRWSVDEIEAHRSAAERAALQFLADPSVARARDLSIPLVRPPDRLDAETAVLFTAMPLEREGRPDGLLLGAIDLSGFLAAIDPAFMSNYGVEIRENGRLLASRGAPENPRASSEQEQLRVGGVRLTIVLVPLQSPSPTLSWVFAVLGLLLSFGLGELVRVLERSREQSSQLEMILDSSPVGMLLTEPTGVILRVNDSAATLFGYARSEFAGMGIEALIPDSARERHVRHRLDFVRHHSGGVGTNQGMEGLRRDGTTFKVDVGLSLVADEGRQFVLAIVQDVSARHRAERALHRRTEELARSNHDLEQFAYVASHDLRAPLRAVDHLSQWILEELDTSMNEEQRENGRLLRSRVRRMDRLLSDLLEYARVTHQHRGAELVHVADLVADVELLLEWPAGFRLVTAPPLPLLRTNPTALRLVLINLIGNALKHHDRDSGTVEVKCVEGPQFIEFLVTDDGPGVPSKYHDKVFEMFQTLRPRDEVEGSGMGLALCRRLIESRGGRITIESPDTRGSTFRFTWPREWREDSGT